MIQLTWEAATAIIAAIALIGSGAALYMRLSIRAAVAEGLAAHVEWLNSKYVPQPVCEERHHGLAVDHHNLGRRIDRLEERRVERS